MDMFERKALAWFLNRFAEIIESDEDFELMGNTLKNFADEHKIPNDARDDFKSLLNVLIKKSKETYTEYLGKSDNF